ncbi:hypothetical protein ACWD25_20115 [Streptomyces sp. NPDC002920]
MQAPDADVIRAAMPGPPSGGAAADRIAEAVPKGRRSPLSALAKQTAAA